MQNIFSFQEFKNLYQNEGKYKAVSAFGNYYLFGILKNKSTHVEELICLEFISFNLGSNNELYELFTSLNVSNEFANYENIDLLENVKYSSIKINILNNLKLSKINFWNEVLKIYESSEQFKSSLTSTKYPEDEQAKLIDKIYNYTYYEVNVGKVDVSKNYINLDFEAADIHGGVDKLTVKFLQINNFDYKKTKFEHEFIFEWEYTPNSHKIVFPNFDLSVNCTKIELKISKENGIIENFEGINSTHAKKKKFLGIF